MRLLSVLLGLIFALQLTAQTNGNLTLSTLPNGVPVYDMPAMDNAELLAKELAARAPGRAPHFAVCLPVDISPENQGIWESVPGNKMRWRVAVRSAGALSLNLGFDHFKLPDGATFRIFDKENDKALGPFTPSDNEAHDQFWTPVVDGDMLILELTVPESKMQLSSLHLSSVNHDYVGFGQLTSASGSCNLDVICDALDGFPQNDDNRDIMQSVAVIGTGGGTFCTGFLINNGAQDCSPLFMTAFHCGINAGNAPSLVAYWNFFNSTCRQPNTPASGAAGDGVLTDFNSGATYLAGSSPTDFVIVEFDDPISETANAYFAGWDATGVEPDSTICIHHPSTDEKRITYSDQSCTLGAFSGAVDNHWHPTWTLGVTEGGSSGSPLFDQDKQVIGQLHGGPSSCTASDLSDFYGAVHISWTGGGTPNTSLASWLDPNGLGILELNGRSALQCAIYIEAIPNNQIVCSSTTATYDLVLGGGFENGVDVTISGMIGDIVVNEVLAGQLPGSTATYTTPVLDGVTPGTYTLNVSAVEGTNTTNNSFTITVVSSVPGVPTLLTPVNADNVVPSIPTFTWNALSEASSYIIEVASDNTFTNILATGTSNVSTWEYNATELAPNGQYFWRVKAINSCGQGEWANFQVFFTGYNVCANTISTNVPVSIPQVGVVSSTLNITGSTGSISDLNVANITGTHTYLGDLIITLTSPSGTTVTLISGACASLNNFNIGFDDEASGPAPCPYNTGGLATPSSPLSAFDGESPNGTWTITFEDVELPDGGTLTAWNLDICTIAPALVGISTDKTNFSGCGLEESTYSTVVAASDAASNPLDLTIQGLPDGWSATFDNSTLQPGESTNLNITSPLGVPSGSYIITIVGTDNTSNFNVTQQYFIFGAPSAPSLILPNNSVNNVPLSTTLSWDNTGSSYAIQVSTTPDFSANVQSFDNTSNNQAFTATQNLQTYYWRVNATNSCGTSDWSETYSFTTVGNYAATGNTQLSSCPTNSVSTTISIGSSFNPATFNLTATGLPSGVTYTYSPQPVVAGGNVTVTFSNLINAPVGNNPFSIVLTDGLGTTTLPSNLNVLSLPGLPNLQLPINNGTGISSDLVVFDWSNIAGATGYQLVLSTDADFSNIVGTYDISSSTITLQDLAPETTYYWQVVTQNACGTGVSSTSVFQTSTSNTFDIDNNSLTIQPNPANQEAVLRSSSALSSDCQVMLVDVSGRKLAQLQFFAGSSQIALPIESLPAGTYWVRITNGAQSGTLPLVIIR